ncbi:CaiB/BaiF CoA transferase family protein [Orrella marina]|uniref:CoA transferase n=1 Tax=Orrella marina TaxID=2163011 RepID=A0A2R4XFX0_9BURK|nr:CoA transferase [Orrella marina]AWB32706.1 CoA transferase [Orrella marina]
MKKILDGLRVIDFTWIGAGSYTTKLLADLGADVIKIETASRLDTLRVTKPFKDGVPGVNRSGYFADRNSSKKSITLNIKHPQGLDLAKQLIVKADLVTNNFTPGVMEKLGLGYDVIRAISPRIVYAAMSMQGSTGPERADLGYGLTITAVTGFQHMTGLPDRLPAGTGTNYPDHIPNPGHAAFAILAALRHQRRTGQGQQIDIAQVEPTLCMIAPSLMNYTVNGVVDTRCGNRHRDYAPQGVYRANGDDRWITISIQNQTQWLALVKALGLPVNDDWDLVENRRRDHDQIDRLIEEETSKHDALVLAARLQQLSIAAGPVNDSRDVVSNDPQLAARGHWVTLNHPEVGPSLYNNSPYRFSEAQSTPNAPAPLIGQHTDEVLEGMLGLNLDQLQELRKSGVLN